MRHSREGGIVATLLDSLTQSLSPGILGSLSQAVGASGSDAQKGLDVVGPLVLGSLARKSQTTGGLDSIMGLLSSDAGGGLLDKIGSLVGRPGASATASMLGGVLGPGASSIGKVLAGRLGFNPMPLISAAAPMLLGMIGKMAKEASLDSAGVARLLQEENKATMSTAKPEVQAALTEAFAAGEKAETLRASYSDDDWRRIRLAPTAVTFYIASASPSGVKGLTQEVVAAGSTVATIVKDAPANSLVDIAFSGFEGKLELDQDKDPFAGQDPRVVALAAVKSAVAAVKSKSPGDATSFGQTLIALSRSVAEASKEGGFLGFGGTTVSKEEEQAIAEITSAVA
jgi:hypothetical protein